MDYLLKQLADKAWVIRNRTNTGIVQLDEGGCLVIDPGQDRESAKIVMESLNTLHLELTGVLITHSHADHYGGTHFLKSNHRVEYFASGFESSLIEQPLLESIFLFGGAEPIPELTHKFILAKPVAISQRLQAGEWEFGGARFRILNLPGHSTGQIGLEYKNLLFGGDSLTLTQFIEKYRFPFYSDVEKAFTTFDLLLKSPCRYFIPGHGEVLDAAELRRESAANRQYLQYLIDLVKRILYEGPGTAEELLGKVAADLETPLVTVVQYVLNRTVILAILKHLQVHHEASSYFEKNRWLWRLS